MKIKKSQLESLIRKNIKHVLNENFKTKKMLNEISDVTYNSYVNKRGQQHVDDYLAYLDKDPTDPNIGYYQKQANKSGEKCINAEYKYNYGPGRYGIKNHDELEERIRFLLNKNKKNILTPKEIEEFFCLERFLYGIY